MSRKNHLRDSVVKQVRRATYHVQIPDTKVTFLAMSEMVRRMNGDAPCNELMLTPYELRVLSQNGEDGVIAEILRRTGTEARYFVEFGGATGVETNCVFLADVLGWHGFFIEGDPASSAQLARKYGGHNGVTTKNAMVTADNVEKLFAQANVPSEFDVLSIDIDGCDYYVWEALASWRPRVVVVEYNSGLPHDRRLVQPRDARASKGSVLFGASIGAMRTLAERKGYRLVHTEMTGCNAFFVRDDLPGDFPAADDVPLRSANYYLRGLTHGSDPDGSGFVDLDRRPS